MNEKQIQQRIADNWRGIEQKVREAAIASAREPESVRIIGVSKYVGQELTRALTNAGCRDLGESRPQVMWQKADSLLDVQPLAWHIIGHLQRNKVRRSLRYLPLIHSVDSMRLIDAIAEEAMLQGVCVKVLLEVNISGDQAKTGFLPGEVGAVLESMPREGVQVQGLMAMAGWGSDPDAARRQFDDTRDLRDHLQSVTGQKLPELSMGMSGDYQEAIRAGATMVRIGSVLFEGVIERK